MSALPTDQEFALSTYNFRLATLLCLGMPIPLSDWSGSCKCGAQLDNSGYHLLTCKTGGGPVWSNNTTAATWGDCLQDVHAHLKREPRHIHSSSDCRPDLVMFESASGANVKLDIALAHPWSSDTFPKSVEIDGAAAKRQEERKHPRYKRELLVARLFP